MSISTLMGTSRIALSAYQTAIDTTSKNISNVDNPDYVRRRTDVSALLSPLSGLAFNEQNNIHRLESGFVQSQLWYKNQFMGRYETDELVYAQVESLFNEPSNSGISSIMGEFWNSWSDLANDPESNTARAIVKDKGVLLASTFNQLSTDLNNMQREVGYDIQDTVAQANRLLRDIKAINEKAGASFSHDLADLRDAAITQLSTIMNIDVTTRADDVVSISTGGNVLVPLVSGDFLNQITTTTPPFSDYYSVEVGFAEGGSVNAITGGSLGSLLDAHNDNIPDYIDQLNQLATGIAQEVNTIHSTGYNLDDVTGIDFFDPDVSGASSFAMNSAIISDPLLIATSDAPGESGNGNLATAVSDLENGYMIQDIKFSDFYNSMISEVGSKVQEAKFLRSSQEMVVNALQNQRDSISGVSLDEEMSNLVRYEQAYQAASRMISVADELIQSVLSLI